MTESEINLEPGLTFYYENEKEFKSKDVPVSKQVALGYEAGRHDLFVHIVKCFKTEKGNTWP